MNRTELFIYRLGLIFTVIGIGFAIASLVFVLQQDYFMGLILGLPMLAFIGFGVDFIVKRSYEDLEWLINFLFNPTWDFTGTRPFRNPDDKSPKK